VVRINSVYTKAGDRGQTSLIDGARVDKDDLRIECYGTVDELNAAVGLARTALEETASKATERLVPVLHRVQNELFNLGAELATRDDQRRATLPQVELRHVERLERDIDELNDSLPALKSFVLPGGGWPSSYFHLARTVCRRAERLAVALSRAETVGAHSVRYLNRLSDALFVFGRWAAAQDGRSEPLWEPETT
jgi:cob(I)alamin adenosyltransferase